MGYIVLEGGAEFGGLMSEPDRRALELAGGFDAHLSIIPAAAAPDNNHQHAGQEGVRWFESLGATQVTVLPLIDPISANNPTLAEALRGSGLIYLLGGFPQYLAQTLKGSLSWKAILVAHEAGAVIAGSSAGAMVLCEYFYDPAAQAIQPGLNLIPGTCVLPHHNSYGKKWTASLPRKYPEILFCGIDEETGMINDGPNGRWRIYGKGSVTLYRHQGSKCYLKEEIFLLNKEEISKNGIWDE